MRVGEAAVVIACVLLTACGGSTETQEGVSGCAPIAEHQPIVVASGSYGGACADAEADAVMAVVVDREKGWVTTRRPGETARTWTIVAARRIEGR